MNLPDLDSYIECALWSSTHFEDENDACGTPMDSLDNELAPETRELMQSELSDFIDYCERDATENDWLELWEELEMSDGQFAHDFWLTRNHHGAGFWDRGLGSVGDKLTKCAHSFGSVDLYVGDDGLIYQQ